MAEDGKRLLNTPSPPLLPNGRRCHPHGSAIYLSFSYFISLKAMFNSSFFFFGGGEGGEITFL